MELQNTIFIWFLDTFDFLVRQAKRLGRWDDGIVEMGTTAGEEVERIRMEEFLGLLLLLWLQSLINSRSRRGMLGSKANPGSVTAILLFSICFGYHT